jgi:hypothetical protein
MRTSLLAPRHYLDRTIREATPGISDEGVRRVIEYVEHERKNDPLLG